MKKNTNIKNKNLTPFAIIIIVILVLYSLSLFLVLYMGILTSLKSFHEFTYGNTLKGSLPNIWGFPDIAYSKYAAELTKAPYNGIFTNYSIVLSNFKPVISRVGYYTLSGNHIVHEGYTASYGHFLLNTFIYAILCPLLTTVISTTAAYLCCKYKFIYSKIFYTVLLVAMTIPIVGNATAQVNILKAVGLYDTYLSMFLMNMHTGGIYFFVLYAFFQGLSDTYIEAAEIDGASQFTVLCKIVIPLAYKTMLTIFVIQLVTLWNTFEAPLMYYPSKPTLAYSVYIMSYGTDFAFGGVDKVVLQSLPVKTAGCMLLSLPTLILFLSLKNVIMGNLTLGGLKE